MLSEDAILLVADRFKTSPTPFTLSNMLKDDQPLVYANDAFCSLTGYNRDDILGRNCRFLQGDETNRATTSRIREDLENTSRSYHCILNYKKSGEAFHNMLMLEPVVAQDQAVLFAGCQYSLNNRDAAGVLRQVELTNQLAGELTTLSKASVVLQQESNHLRTRSIMSLIQAYIRVNSIKDLSPKNFSA